ncbi:acylphosphatase [Candidatus Vondammii sp. HM_W22]|uniref:acylphosphatase n=1 Tax=Candidatus Vondammii sp. HM_W22 TaxID=2687299 RepID=UPI001F1446B6|nr:acylphosphatase [Candidatus Vondammii sp. HM_W22]
MRATLIFAFFDLNDNPIKRAHLTGATNGPEEFLWLSELDGTVEVVACGELSAIDQFKAWLTRGSPGARVSGVSCELMDKRSF